MHSMPSRNLSSNQKKSFKPPKAMASTTPLKTTEASSSNKLPIELQQRLLDIFKNSYAPRFDSHFSATVQRIKQHLFNRDFQNAFGQQSFLEVYAMRWSPSRALAYTHIFWDLFSKYHLDVDKIEQASRELPLPASQVQSASTKPVVCIGGGAGAELVALGAYPQVIGLPSTNLNDSEDNSNPPPSSLAIKSIDIADWSTVLQKLHSCMTAAPPISEYSSSAAKIANAALISPADCTLSFTQEDVLGMKNGELATAFTNAGLVTLMFTLNELYNTSISSTTNLLLSLTMLLAPGAMLLVVDSPGSYSTVNLGEASNVDDRGTRKRYPMQWLLDHTLLESAAISTSKNASAERQWEKLESKESEWFRLSRELRYPVSLEDMRYQVHLYRRL